MSRYLWTSLRMALFTIVLVIMYALSITGMAQLIFPRQANGSLIHEGRTVRGSLLLGQSFTAPGYFHPRPSTAGDGYDPLASGGSNLGPTSRALHDRIIADVERARGNNPRLNDVPVDMVTASGSGLDPDITPANALAQMPRVAQERQMDEDALRSLIRQHITPRQFGILGEPRVNVVQLNRALDALQGRPAQ